MALGLPDHVSTCLFDLDGVLTQTAKVHATAWKHMFDEYLKAGADQRGGQFVPFDKMADYDEYVDGKPRYDGVRSFVESRKIELPHGTPDDSPGEETVDGLGNRKTEIVPKIIKVPGVEPYEGSVRYVNAARDAALHRVVVSSSTNAAGVDASQAAVFEDALAGVAAGRAGNFGIVVGVDRVGQADELHRHGADVVVKDLSELLS